MALETAGGLKTPPRRLKGKYRGRQVTLLSAYIFNTLPRVKKLLGYWKWEASLGGDPELCRQALLSIHNKSFHCYGGAVFATSRGKWEPVLLDLIIAYQTLCDYLDNLCDRAHCTDGRAFFQLHESLIDALSPEREKQDYYRYYPFNKDGDYISKLVDDCRRCINLLPNYKIVYHQAVSLAKYYIELQVYKHIRLEERETVLINWAQNHLKAYPDLLWQEFAAASGSTLAIFALFDLAAGEKNSAGIADAVVETYFPWICGLHILLDYLIDQAEDRCGGDLNFTFYYPDEADMRERLKFFVSKSLEQAEKLPDPVFTVTIVEGLLAMYLSDKKVKQQGFEPIARELLNQSSRHNTRLWKLCKLVRNCYLEPGK